MDFNIVVLSGRLAAQPEIRTFESGAILMKMLITVRSESPTRRLDVIPVARWNPSSEEMPDGEARGCPVWVAGSAQRRFWSATDGRHSRIEILAHAIEYRPEDASADVQVVTAS